MEINNQNYFEKENSLEYMGASQFKDFLACEANALAKIKGEVEEKMTTAMLVGSYVDAYFSKELSTFTQEHPEIFNKQGTLKADYVKAEEIIKVIEQDEMMMKYLAGESQVVLTGTIAGVKFKIKIDSYFPNKAIVDQKIMKDLNPVWVEGMGWTNFVEAWGYDIQGAIYQEIVLQKTGKRLPFILNVATKEEVPDKALIEIDQERLDECLEVVKANAPRFAAIKRGEIAPHQCGKCNYCRSKKKVSGVFSYHALDKVYN